MSERVENAAAQLLIELAFLVPKGTDFNTHPISKDLIAFKEAVFRDGQASCAPWMQHKPDCDLVRPKKFYSAMPEECGVCSCGLAAHLAKGGTT